MGIGFVPESGRAAAEDFGFGQKVNMDFKPYE
jgi:hypothetical protein